MYIYTCISIYWFATQLFTRTYNIAYICTYIHTYIGSKQHYWWEQRKNFWLFKEAVCIFLHPTVAKSIDCNEILLRNKIPSRSRTESTSVVNAGWMVEIVKINEFLLHGYQTKYALKAYLFKIVLKMVATSWKIYFNENDKIDQLLHYRIYRIIDF